MIEEGKEKVFDDPQEVQTLKKLLLPQQDLSVTQFNGVIASK
jgi:hypothetical protein